jgi:hypothetical protein
MSADHCRVRGAQRWWPPRKPQAYQNYIDPTLKSWPQAYYAQNLQRLVDIRKQVDPHHYFKFPQAIGA